MCVCMCSCMHTLFLKVPQSFRLHKTLTSLREKLLIKSDLARKWLKLDLNADWSWRGCCFFPPSPPLPLKLPWQWISSPFEKKQTWRKVKKINEASREGDIIKHTREDQKYLKIRYSSFTISPRPVSCFLF
jgi:hypothetical protein